MPAARARGGRCSCQRNPAPRERVMTVDSATKSEERPEVWIVAVGSMFDAVNFFGPFDSSDVAADWADRNAPTGWWVLRLENPNE